MNSPEEKPPMFRRWRGWYWLIMLVMTAQILLYMYITYLFA